MSPEARAFPLDPVSRDRLAGRGLRYAVLDATDRDAHAAMARAMTRGFHGGHPSDADLAERFAVMGWRRTLTVTDDAFPDADPVATVQSWISPLTLPGAGGGIPGRELDAWAISGVTVSPTHARRGIARAMLEGELRAAAAAGIPLAMLTVSEATLYERYGFGPAAFAADWTIDRRRVRWSGPRPAGTLAYIDNAAGAELLSALHESSRTLRVGDVRMWEHRWHQICGIAAGDEGGAKRVRIVSYTDPAGAITGAVVTRVSGEDDGDFTDHRLAVDLLLAATDDSYAALWAFAVEMPLVSTVTAPLRRVDEPVRWMLGDARAAVVRTIDHQWVRILDVVAALGGRGYACDGSVVLEVADELGFAAGTYRLEVTGGEGVVTPEADPVDAVALSVSDLSSLLLGGVDAGMLATAGRIRGSAAAVRTLAALMTTPTAPWLGTWY